ncbi:hypothetical protein DZC72_13860 [Maribacter algicola]|uniref:Sperm nuclear basic protein PL-I n=1 Tax=Maribacter algicola TaxID=2498892 RepID=A0A3R8Q381_9FLAO|nr:hypothetical protein [Maribacter algicola]RRQ48755.1 hypothetical protein DZC72_13860 [Maribacter algicola]
MKNLVLLFTAMILGTTGVLANGTVEDKVATRNAYRYNNSFIFVENGITFSVYPDGEFDFYIEDYVTGRRNGITFNSGYDYSPYAQYDDYGAVIQVENVPIYYDFYGRVNQIGDVDIRYRNNRVRSVGGMFVFYDNRGFYDYHTGFINIYNRHYVYRPFHGFFVRPAIGFALVFNRPYRRFYTPIRYTYYRPYKFNTRRAYVNIGREHRYNQVRRERASIYRNDNRVAVRENSYRGNKSTAYRKNDGVRSNNNTARRSDDFKSGRSVASSNNGRKTDNSVRKSSSVNRSSSTTVRRGSDNNTVRSNEKRKVVSTREATKTPRSTTVKRSTTTYASPTNRSTASRSNESRTVTQRTVKRTVTPSNNRSTVSKSTRSVSKAPSRGTTRSSNTRSASRRNYE